MQDTSKRPPELQTLESTFYDDSQGTSVVSVTSRSSSRRVGRAERSSQRRRRLLGGDKSDNSTSPCVQSFNHQDGGGVKSHALLPAYMRQTVAS